MVPPDDADARKEILLLSPSILVPCLTHDGIKVWDTLAIGEYLNEIKPKAGLLPADRAARAHCRAICGEMHSGFTSLRSALPMNLKRAFPGFKVWARAQADIDRITDDLARLPRDLRRPVPVRQAATHGRRDVRAGRHALRHLRREARPASARRTASASWRCRRWSSGSRPRKHEPDEIDELDMEF